MALSISGCIQNRNGVYYFRRSIPKEIRSKINQSELVLSLRTRLRQEAISRSIACLEITNRIFAEVKMSDGRQIDPNFKARVLEALRKFEQQSTSLNEDLPYISPEAVASNETLEGLLALLDGRITSPQSHEAATTGPIADFTEFVRQSQTTLQDIGSSDPKAANAFLQRETLKHFRTIVANTLASRQDPTYSPQPARPLMRMATLAPIHRHEGSPTIMEAWEIYVSEKGGNWRRSTANQYNSRIREFTNDEFVGNKRLSELTRDDLVNYRNCIQRLPAQWRKLKEYRDKPIKELAAMDIPKKQLLSDRSINERLITLGSFFEWCKKAKKYAIQADLTYDTHIKNPVSAQRASYTDDELRVIFDSGFYRPVLVDKPYKFWAPLISSHSGARLSEICQLEITDIIEVDHIAAFRITEMSESQNVKTIAGIRLVPLHKNLLELGFLKYVESIKALGHTRLFPDLKPGVNAAGGQASKWFTTFRRKRGIPDTDALGLEKVFHSFRNTVTTRLRHHQNPAHNLAVIQQIVGHEQEERTTAIYTDTFPIRDCKAVIDTLQIPIDIEALKAAWLEIPEVEPPIKK